MNATTDAPTHRRHARWWLVVGIVAAAVLFYTLGLNRYFSWSAVVSQLDFYQTLVARNLPVALAVYFALYVAVTALSLPIAAVVSLLGGALFGLWLAAPVVAVGATIGATLAFLASRFLFRDAVERRFQAKLETLNAGVECDGAYYLFALRLVPAFPFFLINLGMGLTRMSAWTFFWVSLLGMLPGTILYVNAGTALATIDSPRDVLSAKVIVSLALLGLFPLVLKLGRKAGFTLRQAAGAVIVLVVVVIAALATRHYFRYRTAPTMEVAVSELSNFEYPEDPASRDVRYGRYTGRSLTLTKKDATHFDFVFESPQQHVAKIVFRDVDVGLMTPSLPDWTRSDPGLVRIALTDRQWNRQQVRFAIPSPHVEISGGDGWEKNKLVSAELAKNCLNAGLWEVLLYTETDGKRLLYYHGWFTFPLGHYRDIFEHNTGLNYWHHFYYLEHWFDPAGTVVDIAGLREVKSEREADFAYDASERILVDGAQVGKQRIMTADNVLVWKDFFGSQPVRFSTFIPPGRYSVQHPWKNEYWRMQKLDHIYLRDVVPPAGARVAGVAAKRLREIELVFGSRRWDIPCRILISGIDVESLPRLKPEHYAGGLTMPMGIGVPPFHQPYETLLKNPPTTSPYFSVMLDDQNRWIDHHKVAVDGPILHRDADDPTRLHIYLLSYERHTLIGHYTLVLD